MVHCITSSEPDSVVSPDGRTSSPDDFNERMQRGNMKVDLFLYNIMETFIYIYVNILGNMYLNNTKPIHYQTELKLRHNQCHQTQFGNNVLNHPLHHKLDANGKSFKYFCK